MAVLCACESGWFVSHHKLVESWYRDCYFPGAAQPSAMKLKDLLFDIRTPFQMDSAAKKQAEMFDASDDAKLSSKTAQKKRKRQPTNDRPLTDFVQAGSWIKRAACEIVSAAVAQGHLDATPVTRQELGANNGPARDAAVSALASWTPQDSVVPLSVGGPVTRRAACVRCRGQPCLVPSGARAHLGDVRQLEAFLMGERALPDISRPRSAYYEFFNRTLTAGLDHIEVKLQFSKCIMCPKDAVCAVWCAQVGRSTARVIPSFTQSWIRVTRHGETVRPFDCPHKKPVEFLVFGGSAREALPRDKVVVSVPSSVHSHKLPLSGV
ncbi:unnamed protein product [Ixodes hexagonus]